MTPNDTKDILAGYVRQLLELDAQKTSKKGTPVSGSCSVTGSLEKFRRSSTTASDSTTIAQYSDNESSPDHSGSEGADSKNSRANQVEFPPGLGPQYVPVSSMGQNAKLTTADPTALHAKRVSASLHLQEAALEMQKALANMESSLQGCSQEELMNVEPSYVESAATSPASRLYTVPTMPLADPAPQTGCAEYVQAAQALALLDQALSKLTVNMPADAATAANNIPHPGLMASPMQPMQPDALSVNWLQQYMQNQQYESDMLISRMVQKKAAATDTTMQSSPQWPFGAASAGVAPQQQQFPPYGLQMQAGGMGVCPLGSTAGFTADPNAAYFTGVPQMTATNPTPSTKASRRKRIPQPGRQGKGTSTAIAQCPQRPPVAPPPEEDYSLRAQLQALQQVEPERVFLVRKINRLGYGSPAALESHYSRYGKVETILVARSLVKANRRINSRQRPAGLGFVVMKDKAAVETILAEGNDQMVAGVTIRVQIFLRYFSEDNLDDAAEVCDDDAAAGA